MPTPMGEITVLEGHLPLVSVVEEGDIRFILPNKEEKLISFPGGVVEIRPKSEVVLLSREEGVYERENA